MLRASASNQTGSIRDASDLPLGKKLCRHECFESGRELNLGMHQAYRQDLISRLFFLPVVRIGPRVFLLPRVLGICEVLGEAKTIPKTMFVSTGMGFARLTTGLGRGWFIERLF